MQWLLRGTPGPRGLRSKSRQIRQAPQKQIAGPWPGMRRRPPSATQSRPASPAVGCERLQPGTQSHREPTAGPRLPPGREVAPLPCHVPWSPRAPPCAEGNPPPGPASQRDSADNPSTPRGERMSPEAHCACSRRKLRPAPGSRSPRGPGPLSSRLRSYLACFLLS